MPDLSVPRGQDKLTISLPGHWQIQQVASPTLKPAPANWRDRLAVALSQPAAGPPLGIGSGPFYGLVNNLFGQRRFSRA